MLSKIIRYMRGHGLTATINHIRFRTLTMVQSAFSMQLRYIFEYKNRRQQETDSQQNYGFDFTLCKSIDETPLVLRSSFFRTMEFFFAKRNII